jgi:catechol 2,3-dioxygenase-like lactoylglutathione lyase family enzyme
MKRLGASRVYLLAAIALGAMGPPLAAAAEPLARQALALKPHHITAAVVDIERAAKWYQEVLGFKLDQRGSRAEGKFQFAELSLSGFGIALIQLPPGVAKPRGTEALAPSWVHIVFSVSDLPAAFSLLKSRGADVFTRDNSAATSSFLLHDSEGNEIEVVSESQP